jgi:Protein of unknown function (DUF3006)
MLLNLTIDRFEDGKAVLKTEDSETVIWPKDKLPENIYEGATLLFAITDNANKDKDSRQLAKDILNEILEQQS